MKEITRASTMTPCRTLFLVRAKRVMSLRNWYRPAWLRGALHACRPATAREIGGGFVARWGEADHAKFGPHHRLPVRRPMS